MLQMSGEPRLIVTPNVSMDSTKYAGFTCAVLRASMSGMMVVTPSAGLKSAKIYMTERWTSPSATPISSRMISTCFLKMPCRYATPFGMPVPPDVKATAASSSVVVGAIGNDSWEDDCNSASVAPSQNSRLPTVTKRRMLWNGVGNAFRMTCANGMPISAVGSVSATHCRNALRPMPGSISTGTAPIFISAKVTAINSTPGRTIINVRSPCLMPYCANPCAYESHSALSCWNVSWVNLARP